MLYYTILYNIYYTILYYTILYYTILYYTIGANSIQHINRLYYEHMFHNSPASKRGQDKQGFCRGAAIYHDYDIIMA